MTSKLVLVIGLIILLLIPANQNLIGNLNAHMEHSECKRKRVKEPKMLSPFIQHEDINQSIDLSHGIISDIKYDGTIYLFILLITIIDWILCLLLVAAVLVAGLVFEYFMWWALLIGICYTAFICIMSGYYWKKSEDRGKSRNYKK